MFSIYNKHSSLRPNDAPCIHPAPIDSCAFNYFLFHRERVGISSTPHSLWLRSKRSNGWRQNTHGEKGNGKRGGIAGWCNHTRTRLVRTSVIRTGLYGRYSTYAKPRSGKASIILGVLLILGCSPSVRTCPLFYKCWTRSYLIWKR